MQENQFDEEHNLKQFSVTEEGKAKLVLWLVLIQAHKFLLLEK